MTCRKLRIAIADEDYALAAALRDEVAALQSKLPVSKQLLLAHLESLQSSNTLEGKKEALRCIGGLGAWAQLLCRMQHRRAQQCKLENPFLHTAMFWGSPLLQLRSGTQWRCPI
jgi:hypothetical protein